MNGMSETIADVLFPEAKDMMTAYIYTKWHQQYWAKKIMEEMLISEHEHLWEWEYDWEYQNIVCSCGEYLPDEEIAKILNNPIVKTMINALISRRDDED